MNVENHRTNTRAALRAGGLIALGVVLAILWIVYFVVGHITAEAFLPFLVVLTCIAAMIVGVNVIVARRSRGAREPLGAE